MTALALLLLAVAAPVRASCLGAEVENFDDFRACQAAARDAAIAAANKKGKPLTDAQLDKLDDLQKQEAKDFFNRGDAVVDDDATAAEKKKKAAAARAKSKKVDPKTAAELDGLKTRFKAAAGDGRNGITPAMADDVRDTLQKTQGGMSDDMKGLLDATSKDGGKLTPETMKKLQDGAKAAKDGNMELGIDPKMEKALLETDFSKDQAPAADPGL